MNNVKNGIENMDIINLYSVCKQLENIAFDDQQTKYIRAVIKAIADEIDKLHKENDVIMEQNKKILDKLDILERKYILWS